MTPADNEILTKIQEECAEIIQAVCKAQLHGMESVEPGQTLTNEDKIHAELGDLFFFMAVAFRTGLLDQEAVKAAIQARAGRPQHYLHHVEL